MLPVDVFYGLMPGKIFVSKSVAVVFVDPVDCNRFIDEIKRFTLCQTNCEFIFLPEFQIFIKKTCFNKRVSLCEYSCCSSTDSLQDFFRHVSPMGRIRKQITESYRAIRVDYFKSSASMNHFTVVFLN